MNPTQQRYSICDQELLALVMALDKLSHLLRVSKVTVYTDHQALTHLQRVQASKPLRGRIAQWLDFSAEFPDLHITYVQGGHNQGADALFRRPGLPNTSLHDTPSAGLMLAIGQGAPRRPRRRSLPSAPSPAQPEPKPEAEHPTLTTKAPANPRDVRQWPRAYSKCSVFRVPYKAAANQPGDALQIEFCNRQFTFRYLLIPSRRWAHVSLDFITDLPLTTTGHDSILVMVESLSKMADFVRAKKSFTAADTVELLADRLIRYHSFPQVLISDRDPRFQSDLWNQLCHRFNIKRCMSSSYHLQSDGQTERVNRTLEQMLRTYIKSDEWE
ncbi:hypothetical protein, conserved [Eimeria tenella]|uniref:Integrase catalytic domain-containing protein n=1 Tax=Eimeria tenella TaxID=5802 RepID=C8TDM5_EIMTE|nr:hypothetical protein, conserved [Eimeria tenella]